MPHFLFRYLFSKILEEKRGKQGKDIELKELKMKDCQLVQLESTLSFSGERESFETNCQKNASRVSTFAAPLNPLTHPKLFVLAEPSNPLIDLDIKILPSNELDIKTFGFK